MPHRSLMPLAPLLFAATLASGAEETPKAPSLSDQAGEAVEAQVREARPAAAPADASAQAEGADGEPLARRSWFEGGVLYQEITIAEWWNDILIFPDYERLVVKTVKGFGVPRGGSSGSPSFDVLTRRYWWE